MTCPADPPQGLWEPKVTPLLESLHDYIGVHAVETDADGIVFDTKLVWWNPTFEAVRTEPPRLGQSILTAYHTPHIAMKHVQDAWTLGFSRQKFLITNDIINKYKFRSTVLRLEISWLRDGDYIVELGADRTALSELEEALGAERFAYINAARAVSLSEERARIAHDLHDSVIQDLFAISLRLQARNPEQRWVVDAIHDVVNEIRETIFKIEPTVQTPCRLRIEKVIASFSDVWSIPLDVSVNVAKELPNDLMEDIECVLREGLSNSARHAKASEVYVSVDITHAAVTVTVQDNGIGPSGQKRRKAGTLSLAHRASNHGGTFSLTEVPGGGSLLRWSCPV